MGCAAFCGVLCSMEIPLPPAVADDNHEVLLPSDYEGSSEDESTHEKQNQKGTNRRPTCGNMGGAHKRVMKRPAKKRTPKPTYPGPTRKEIMVETMIQPRAYTLWHCEVPRYLEGCIPDDFMEVYSQPRVTTYVIAMGLRASIAADKLTGWDFELADHRLGIMMEVKSRRPKVLGLSPPCTWFSGLQNLNWAKMPLETREHAFRMALVHVQFAMLLADHQVSHGRMFYFEHPDAAMSWQEASVQTMASQPSVAFARLHMCAYGMVSPVKKVPMIKPTKLMTNLTCLQCRCDKTFCPGHPTHQIIQGMEGGIRRSEHAQVYPSSFCRMIAEAVREYVQQ